MVGVVPFSGKSGSYDSQPPYLRVAPGERRVLEEVGARSVICVAVPIQRLPEALAPARSGPESGSQPQPGLPSGPEPAPAGVIARYAARRDYHQVIASWLQELKGRLERQVGRTISSLISVDKGPLADKRWAFRAGLGRWAPNTLIWTPQYGTWVHLGELALDLDLPGDPSPELAPGSGAEHGLLGNREGILCSECGRCVSSCPTGALVEPYVLKRERCLSYLTQRRGLVPEDMRPFFQDRLWGCDRCQEACPANPKPARLAEGPPRLRLESLINLDRKQFQAWLGLTAMSWKGPQLLRRNAAIVLGNLARGHEDPSPALAWLPTLARDPSPVVRAHARWALAAVAATS